MLAAGSRRSAWWAGTVTMGVAKIIENMEIGHNVMHGQWDWMNDPEIHSSTWEWDMSGASKHWRFTHNFMHHKYTNILGMDDDVGYGLLRVTRDEKWKPFNLGNLFFNTMLALGFEWGVGLQHLELGRMFKGRDDRDATMLRMREFSAKAGRQLAKDYVAWPAVTSVAGCHLQIDVEGQRGGQRDPERVGQRRDLLRPFPRRRREIHQDRHGRRDQGPVVPAADARQRQLRGRPCAAVHERQPVPPDRAPPLSGSAEQSAARDLGAGQAGLRQVRPALHHRLVRDAVRQDMADHRQAVAAGQVSARHGRQCSGDPQRADVHGAGAWLRCYGSGHRSPSRSEDRHRHGARLASRQAGREADAQAH